LKEHKIEKKSGTGVQGEGIGPEYEAKCEAGGGEMRAGSKWFRSGVDQHKNETEITRSHEEMQANTEAFTCLFFGKSRKRNWNWNSSGWVVEVICGR
jgi:hypothetical protein